MPQTGQVIDFHIQAVFPITVLNKDHIPGRQKRFQPKMPPVVIVGAIQIFQAVQSVFHGMIINMFIVQIIPDGIAVTVYINIPVLLKIHCHIRFFPARQLLCIQDTIQKVPQDIMVRLFILCQLGKGAVLFLFQCKYLLKDSRFLQPFLQAGKIRGYGTEGNIRFPPIFPGEVPFL